MTNNQLLQLYQLILFSAAFSENTRLVYGRRARDFVLFADSVNFAISDCSYETGQQLFERYRQNLSDRLLSPSTICSALSAVDHFFLSVRDFRIHIKRPIAGCVTFDPDFESGMYQQLFRNLGLLSIRDRAIMLIIACCAIRADQCAELKVTDYIKEDNESFLLVDSTGTNPRLLKLSGLCSASIQFWLAMRAKIKSDEDTLFIVRSGGRLSPEMMYATIRKCGVRTGTKLTARSLRRAALSHMATKETSIELLSLYSGAKLSTIRRYRAGGGEVPCHREIL